MKSIVGIAAALLLAGLAQAHEGPFDEGKTRAQARQDLEQAYRDGVLPFRRSEYPPTAASKKKTVTHTCERTLKMLPGPRPRIPIQADK